MDKQLEEQCSRVHTCFTSMSRCTWQPLSSIAPPRLDVAGAGGKPGQHWQLPHSAPQSGVVVAGRWGGCGGGVMHHAVPWRNIPEGAVTHPPSPIQIIPSPTPPAFRADIVLG